jgi:hypothetical protein
MFLVLFSVLFGSFVLIRGGGPQGFLEKYTNQSHITITPLVMGESEAIPLLFLCASALIMGVANLANMVCPCGRLWERISGLALFADSLPSCGTLLTMFLFHGFRITGPALHGTAIVSSLLGWGIAWFACS